MATETRVTEATPADLAADMDYHRKTYGRFLSLLKISMVVATIILAILFFSYI